MGTQMRFPEHNPKAHLEWEDTEFTDRLLNAILIGEPSNSFELRSFFRQYITNRTGNLWGVKTPFLLPYLKLFKELAEAIGYEVKTILTYREENETFKSIEEQCSHKPDMLDLVKGIQYKLITSRIERQDDGDLVVDIKDTWNNPDKVKGSLKRLIGVN